MCVLRRLLLLLASAGAARAQCGIGSAPDATGNCATCGTGLYTTAVGASACFPCNVPGVFMQLGMCQGCALGQYCVGGGSAPCGVGTASTALAASFCPGCAAGTFANTTAATACAACAPGTYAPSPSATACALCDIGTYASAPGAVGCAACPLGATTVAPGTPTCQYPLGVWSNQSAVC